jgi:hypothetical protein
VYRKLDSANICGEVQRESVVRRWRRGFRPLDETVCPCSKLDASAIHCNSVHKIEGPGAILKPVSRSPQKGADTLVWLATSPDVANVSGRYFIDQQQRPPSPEAGDTETAGRLWEISKGQCAVSGRSAEARS